MSTIQTISEATNLDTGTLERLQTNPKSLYFDVLPEMSGLIYRTKVKK